MRNRRSSGYGGPDWDDLPINDRADGRLGHWQREPENSNSAEDVFGEVGLVLVIVLGVVLAVNMLLVGFHIS